MTADLYERSESPKARSFDAEVAIAHAQKALHEASELLLDDGDRAGASTLVRLMREVGEL